MVRAFVISAIVAVLAPAVAVAKQPPRTTLTVSPAITEWLVAPGKKASKKVMVANTTKEPLPVSVLVRPFRLQETDYLNVADSLRYDASSWLRVTDGDFILKPGKTREVALTVTIPHDAPPGGHYATAYFRQLRPAGSAGAQAQVGTLVFITVKGKIEKRLEGENMSARWNGSTLAITAKLRNAGNVHEMPEGSFVVLDWRGKEVGKVALPRGMVMPRTSRTFQAAFERLGPGVYTIRPQLSYGGKPVALAGVTVWAVPWKAMLGAVGVALVGWFGVYTIRDRWKRAFSALTRGSG